jgi:hypothetical protein
VIPVIKARLFFIFCSHKYSKNSKKQSGGVPMICKDINLFPANQGTQEAALFKNPGAD